MILPKNSDELFTKNLFFLFMVSPIVHEKDPG